ncbi:SHOCT domain-containing protein [Catellatospora sp. NPDC049133]|uniref:SHOCT domain-containing protein n=1 Tax=Catellatospora sp. NPDC049133 TaxID=3155499 RepID=UPI0033CED3BF
MSTVMGDAMGWMWIWPAMIVFGLLVLGFLALVVTQYRPGGAVTTPHPDRPPARTILDERYARGEIDEEEYRRRKGELP